MNGNLQKWTYSPSLGFLSHGSLITFISHLVKALKGEGKGGRFSIFSYHGLNPSSKLPNPIKSDRIRPNPTESDQIRPNPTKSNQIRQSPSKSDRILTSFYVLILQIKIVVCPSLYDNTTHCMSFYNKKRQ